jgi:hypothetical protein
VTDLAGTGDLGGAMVNSASVAFGAFLQPLETRSNEVRRFVTSPWWRTRVVARSPMGH